jgi:hypothetical protein
MLPDKPILLLLEDSQPDNDIHAIGPWGHGPLVGGTAIILHLFLFYFCYSNPLHSALTSQFCFCQSTPSRSALPYLFDLKCI